MSEESEYEDMENEELMVHESKVYESIKLSLSWMFEETNYEFDPSVDDDFVQTQCHKWKKMCEKDENGFYLFSTEDFVHFLEQAQVDWVDKLLGTLMVDGMVDVGVNPEGNLVYKLTEKGKDEVEDLLN